MRKTLLALLLLGFLSLVWAQADRLAFVTSDGQIATLSRDGSALRVLTEGAQRLQFPAWSPDGNHLAAIGFDPEGSFVTVLEDRDRARAHEPYRDTRLSPIYLYWSPDSARLGFLANHPSDGLALYVAPKDGKAELLATGSPFYWQWTSKSERVFLHSGLTGEGSRLGFSSSVRDTLQENLAPPGLFQAPGISESGRFIAYSERGASDISQLVLRNNALMNPVETVRALPHQGLVALSWRPGSEQLAFSSPLTNAPTFNGPINLLDAETGLLEPLTDKAALAFFWSPDGRYLAFLSRAQSNDNLAQQTSPFLLASLQGIQGSSLLDLYILDMNSGQERRLTSFAPSPWWLRQFLPFFDQYALSHRIWSPQSDALVVPAMIEGRSQITVIPLDGQVSPIAEGDLPFWQQ